MALNRQQRKMIVALLRPDLQKFTAAIAEERAKGATEADIDALIQTVADGYRGVADQDTVALMIEELRRVARPQHAAPASLQ